MEQLTDRKNHPCWAPFDCICKAGNTCIFWEKVKEKLFVLQKDCPNNSASCCLNLIDTLREPCLELDEEGRRRGIEDVFGLSE